MNPGKLNRRITIQQLPDNVDQFNTPEPDTVWRDVARVWAAVEPLSGREYIILQNVSAEVTTRIKMRYRPGIKPDMRVLYAGRVYDIHAVLDIEEAHKEMHLMCVERIGG